VVLLAVLAPVQARADDPPPSHPLAVDPVSDIVLTGSSAGFAALLAGVTASGEIHPSPLTPGAESKLLAIDRLAVTQSIDPHAATYSNVALYAALGFAALDPVMSGLRDGWPTGLVDAVMYAESLSITEALTYMTKIAVRRPRPIKYIQCEGAASDSPACASTDLQLSFFSGHAATVASIAGTATYLAFLESPRSPRPWVTLMAGTLLTTFVSYERVRAAAHFPTDVIAGALVGASVGVLVPHLHRHAGVGRDVWVGASALPGSSGRLLTISGTF
jgi:undecaprenyl-diphosphatase